MRKCRHIADGVRSDCNRLMQRFIESNSVRFSKFAELWQDMKFSLIFLGRENAKELREFVEECFRIVISYWSPYNTFQKKVGAIYMLYAFYLKQPLNPKTKIRIQFEDFKEIKAILEVATRENHYDIAFIIHKLMSFFHFVAYPTMLGPRASLMGESEETYNVSRLEDLMSTLRSYIDDGYLEQLSTLHQEYQKSKESQPIESIKNLTMVEEDVGSRIEQTMLVLLKSYSKNPTGRDVTATAAATSQSDEDYFLPKASRRAMLREKQFMAAATVKRSRRHRAVQMDDSSSSPSKKEQQKKRGRPKKQSKKAKLDEEKVDDPSDDSDAHYEATTNTRPWSDK